MHTGAEGLSRTPRKDDSRIARQSLSPAAIVSPKGEVSPTPASVTEGSFPVPVVGAAAPGGSPLAPPPGELARRPAAVTEGGLPRPVVGATLAVARRPPCHCEPVTDVTGVAIRLPPKPSPSGGRWQPPISREAADG